MKVRRLWAVAWKEFLHISRDPRSLFLAVAMPMVLLMLFGYALSQDVDNVPIVILDWNETVQSRNLIAKFSGSKYFRIIGQTKNYRELENLINKREAFAALIIPPDFGSLVDSGRSVSVQMILDGSDANTATIAAGYGEAVVSGFSQDLTTKWVLLSGGKRLAQPFDIRSRTWYNPDMVSRNSIIPGLMGVILMILAALLTPLTIAREWETGTMEQLISTPVKGPELILGKLLPYFIIGMVDVSLAVAVSRVAFAIPLKGSLMDVLSISAMYLAGGLSLGILISVVTKNQLLANQIAMLLTFLPAMMLSGFITPICNMPDFIQYITNLFPARFYVTLIKGIYLKGLGIEMMPYETGLLAIYGMLMVGLSVVIFRKRLS